MIAHVMKENLTPRLQQRVIFLQEMIAKGTAAHASTTALSALKPRQRFASKFDRSRVVPGESHQLDSAAQHDSHQRDLASQADSASIKNNFRRPSNLTALNKSFSVREGGLDGSIASLRISTNATTAHQPMKTQSAVSMSSNAEIQSNADSLDSPSRPPQSVDGSESVEKSSLEKYQSDLDEIIASECIYCGEAMIRSVDRPFITDEEVQEINTWAI